VWTKNLSEYERICRENQSKIPVYFQPWWLHAACGKGNWKPYVHVPSETIWPVYRKFKWCIPYVTMPPLTPRLGWYSPGIALPHEPGPLPFRPFHMVQHVANNSTLKYWFETQGFTVTERSFYLRESPFVVENLWESLSSMSKRQIKKAEAQLRIQPEQDASVLHDMMLKSLRRHQIRHCIAFERLQEMVLAALQHQSGCIWTARDAQERPHAAAFMLWDEKTLYFVGGGLDESIKQIGASRLLLWKGIELAAQTGKAFEFGGGSDPGVGAVYDSMGGRKKIYYVALRSLFR
jgi:hypothetical protein